MKLTAEYFKAYLLSIYKPAENFSLSITNKTPKTRAGYYNIFNRHIGIHYIGTYDLQQLHNIAIHEFAHHIHYTELNCRKNEERTHGKEFYTILNTLLTIAVEKGLHNEIKIEHLLNNKKQ